MCRAPSLLPVACLLASLAACLAADAPQAPAPDQSAPAPALTSRPQPQPGPAKVDGARGQEGSEAQTGSAGAAGGLGRAKHAAGQSRLSWEDVRPGPAGYDAGPPRNEHFDLLLQKLASTVIHILRARMAMRRAAAGTTTKAPPSSPPTRSYHFGGRHPAASSLAALFRSLEDTELGAFFANLFGGGSGEPSEQGEPSEPSEPTDASGVAGSSARAWRPDRRSAAREEFSCCRQTRSKVPSREELSRLQSNPLQMIVKIQEILDSMPHSYSSQPNVLAAQEKLVMG